MRNKLLAAILAAAGAGSLFAADINVPRIIDEDTTWTSDNTYFLEGYTFVVDGATLEIEAGTVIKARQSTGADAAALIITRGSQIMAEGTASEPIIFTSELDELDGNLTHEDTSLWGGVIILGNASINSRANSEPAGTPAQDQVEGLSVTGDEIEYATFGGTDDEDNSGVFRYVSIRHGGAVIGGDNEINGLTLGGVGSGTTIDHIEVFGNKDDGIEFFGGTVDVSHVVLAFGNDDGLDFDQGYRGSVQFVFLIQTDIETDRGDKAIEWDGATSPLDAEPKAVVTVANATFIGIGESGAENTAVNIRDNVEAMLYNSVFVNFAKGLDIEDDVGDPIPDIAHNVWYSHLEANNTADGLNARPAGAVDGAAYWETEEANNAIEDPMLRAISYGMDAELDPRPAAESPLWTGDVQDLTGLGLTQTTYKGAFGDTNWAQGWTKLSLDGYFVPSEGGESPIPDKIEGSTGKPINLSTRGMVGTGDQVLIAGFVVGGDEEQQVVIRAVGPGLSQFENVSGLLADPVLELYDSEDELIDENDDWVAEAGDRAASVGAFPLEDGSTDAIIVVNLEPGEYTAVVRGKNDTTGVALVEVYEVD